MAQSVTGKWGILKGILAQVLLQWLTIDNKQAYLHMEPIDKPFRLSRDFCLVWALLTPAIFFLTRRLDFGPWYSHVAFFIVVPFIATFFVYGPVLFVRQIIRSGSRGWFVARVFLSTLLVLTLFFIGLSIFGHGKDVSGLWGFVAASVATSYLQWRIDQKKS